MARRYTRDNRGRFASVGATARGGRLATASGKKRETQMAKIKGGAASGTIGKPKGLKPGAIKAKPAAKSAARRADRAEANIPMRGVRGRRLDAEITRNVNAQKRQERAADKARNRQAKTEVSRAKKLRDAHIGSIAKAKGLSKGQVESALKAQPASTQIKALKNWVKVNRAAVKPAGALAKPKGLEPGAIKATTGRTIRGQVSPDKALRVSRMKRAQARYEATADTRNQPESKMVRRPDAKTSRSNRRVEQARAIYMGASVQSISNYAKGVARTSKARNNWMQPRSARVAQAKRAGLPLVTVSSTRRRK